MNEAPPIDPKSFDTWIYAMEAYRAGIAGEESPFAENYGAGLIKANAIRGARIVGSLAESYLEMVGRDADPKGRWKASMGTMDASFEGHDPKLLENAHYLIKEFCEPIMGGTNPYQNLFRAWVINTPEGQQWLMPEKYMDAQGQPKSRDEIRAEISREIGTQMKERHEALGLAHPHSVQMNDGKPFYLVQTKDGKHTKISEEKLVQLLRKEPSNKGPHIVMTGNHCWLEEIDPDVTMATKDVERLVKAATGHVVPHLDSENKDVDIVPNEAFTFADGGMDEGEIDALTDKDSLLVTLCYTKENNFLNLAALFERLVDIKSHKDNPREDDFAQSSPASHQWVSTVLKVIAENAEDVVMPSGEGKPNFTKDGAPIKLSVDAPERVKDLICYAFSQGGNSMRDAMRLLVHTLHSEQVDVPAGYQMREGETNIREAFARELLPNISMTVAGLNETPMLKYYADAGAHVALITQRGDKIASHHEEAPHAETRVNPMIIVDGEVHSPKHVMDAILGDVRTRARVFSHFAPLVGRASVATLDYANYNAMQFELAPTTHRLDFEREANAMVARLKELGVDASVERAGKSSLGREAYELQVDGLFTDKDTFKAVNEVIHEQRHKPGQPMFFNEVGKIALRKLSDQMHDERRAEPVKAVHREIEEMYRDMNNPQRAANDNHTGVPASDSLDLADAVVAPMLQASRQVAMWL